MSVQLGISVVLAQIIPSSIIGQNMGMSIAIENRSDLVVNPNESGGSLVPVFLDTSDHRACPATIPPRRIHDEPRWSSAGVEERA
jgi:hypothetical protein